MREYRVSTPGGIKIANVKVEDDATVLVRWSGTAEWVDDPDALGLILFPDDLGVKLD